MELFLDGNCSWGHSTYANSDNNGPWGDAFVNEFLPALEKKYRCNGARFLAGHSSGGWSALWLVAAVGLMVMSAVQAWRKWRAVRVG